MLPVIALFKPVDKRKNKGIKESFQFAESECFFKNADFPALAVKVQKHYANFVKAFFFCHDIGIAASLRPVGWVIRFVQRVQRFVGGLNLAKGEISVSFDKPSSLPEICSRKMSWAKVVDTGISCR